MSAPPFVVPVTALGPVSAGTVAWRTRGALYLTVVVKGTFALAPEGRMSTVEPDPIAASEQPDPGGLGPRTAGDLAPYLGKPEVWLVGHAAVPPGFGQPSFRVDLMVVQGGVVRVCKQLDLDVARSAGNPRGVRIAAAGPISASWPVRSRWLEGVDRRRLSGPVLDIPESLSWEYFQTSPADQRLDGLRGDETLVLGGMVAGRPRLRTQLPAAAAVARVYRRSSAAPRSGDRVGLWPDTLQVDVDRLRCSILWRGRVPLANEAELESLRVVAALEQPGQAVAWVDPFAAEEAARQVGSMSAVAEGQTVWFEGPIVLPLELEARLAAVTQTPAGLPPQAKSTDDTPYSSTAGLTPADLGKIAEQAPMPFEKPRPARPTLMLEPQAAGPPVPAVAVPAPTGDPAFSGTSALTLDDLHKIAEQAATPFEKAPAPAPAAAAPSQAVAVPASHADLAFSGTSALTLDDLHKIAEQAATPFEKAPASARQPTMPAARPAPTAASRAELAFSGTSALTLDDLQKIAEQAATPFEEPRVRAEPPQEIIAIPVWPRAAPVAEVIPALSAEVARPAMWIDPEPSEAPQPGGMGAEFLAAMEEAGALG